MEGEQPVRRYRARFGRALSASLLGNGEAYTRNKRQGNPSGLRGSVIKPPRGRARWLETEWLEGIVR
jgi:hypothetical protein